VLQVDGKGIVMRPDALPPATAKAAAKQTHKLSSRLSKGEKGNRKRLAELGAVYDATPVPRAACDIFPTGDTERQEAKDGPGATNKWLVASIAQDAATVIALVFDEADRRDPPHTRNWVALVDGNVHQINRIEAEATARNINVVIVCDLVHVVEYLSAPRGARLYPPLSGERLEEISLGPMAYLDLKEKREPQHAINQWPCPRVGGGALGDPRDMAKAGLPDSQFPEGATRTPAGKAPETGAVRCPGPRGAWRNSPWTERCPARVFKEMSGTPKRAPGPQARQPRQARHGVDHRRATCIERCPRGSEPEPRGTGPAIHRHLTAWLTRWKATWSRHREADPAAEKWVRRQALAILDGDALKVARAIRRQGQPEPDPAQEVRPEYLGRTAMLAVGDPARPRCCPGPTS
jgi:hypothetical protein